MPLKEYTPLAKAPRSLPCVVCATGDADTLSSARGALGKRKPSADLVSTVPQVSKDDFRSWRRFILFFRQWKKFDGNSMPSTTTFQWDAGPVRMLGVNWRYISIALKIPEKGRTDGASLRLTSSTTWC